MPQVKFSSAGVSAREIDQSGPVAVQPAGIPAGVIGTALKGPAFVPVTVGLISDFYAKFGLTDGKKFGPLAVVEWLKNSQAVTYLRVLGIGNGQKRSATGVTNANQAGAVVGAGFVVGDQQPDAASGFLSSNPYANPGGPLGRTYFLGAFMANATNSTLLSDAGLVPAGSTTATPIVRGVILAASGVILRLSSSFVGTNSAPGTTQVANDATANGSLLGTVVLSQGNQSLMNFTMLLNGHKGLDPRFSNVITASFDPTAANYFPNVLNQDPLKLQQAGHVLYSYWDVHPAMAVVTGSGLVAAVAGAGSAGLSGSVAGSNRLLGAEAAAFLTTGSTARNVGDTFAPNFENFQDRFRHAQSPWIISQRFGGKAQNLFRFHMLDDGAGTANKIKISIENVAPSSDTVDKFGTFDVIIRDFNDTDVSPRVLEQYRGLTLNPSADRYIGKAIGDLNVRYDFDRVETAQKIVVDGNYTNRSNYVRVEIDSGIDQGTTDPTALPVGFRGPAHLVTSGSAPLTDANTGELVSSGTLWKATQLPVPYRLNVTDGTGAQRLVNASYYWGVQFEQVQNPLTPNATNLKNNGIVSYTKYFPDYMTTIQNVLEAGQIGVADSTQLGIIDADRFNNNQFTLENISVVTASNGLADPTQWQQAQYFRAGNIVPNDSTKTRALSVADFIQTNRRYLKFTLFMNGGFDGVNIFDNDMATLSDNAVRADMNDANRGLTAGQAVKSYLKALDVMKNKTDVDILLLAIPGIRHPIITNSAIDAVEGRFDALYIMDIEEVDNLNAVVTSSVQIPSVTNTVNNFKNRALNTSFAAAYYPDTIITDPNTNSNVVCPASVSVLGAFAINDAVAFPWFAAAGFTRGALASTLEAKVKLSKDNMDNLYDANINPLVSFVGNNSPGTQAQGGVVVWGQRTLQSFASALDRVNVRRLLIDIRRQTREIANTILFEPNRESTLAKFQSAIEPRLAKIKTQNGVDRYLVKIDVTTTTQADIDNNTIRGKIFVQPTKSIEYVSLDFVVTNQGGLQGV